MTSDGRFSVVDQPRVNPGECGICKSVTGGPFVDTMLDLDFFGVLYICTRCLDEMHGLVHGVPEEKPEETESEAYQRGKKDGNDQAWAVAKETLNAALGNAAASAGHDIPTDPAGLVPIDPVDSARAPKADGKSKGSSAGASKSGKPDERDAGKQGPDDVSGNSSDGPPQFDF